MAEFVEVMNQRNRMCKHYESCLGCKISREMNHRDMSCFRFINECAEEAEKIIMEWAAAHPEPKYPSWNEWWEQTFSDAVERSAPCWRYLVDPSRLAEFCVGKDCENCRNRPIPADVAEKLGIKPIGGLLDE